MKDSQDWLDELIVMDCEMMRDSNGDVGGYMITDLPEFKQALQEHFLKEALEMIKQTESNWGNGKPLCDPDELRNKFNNTWGGK